MRIRRLVLFLALGCIAVKLAGQTPVPQIVKKDGRFALMVDGAPYLMLGAQMHNSSNWPDMLPKVWPTIEALHANTLEAPIYWEQWEPHEGRFDSSQVHLLIDQARAHHVHLVLLWFGTWKNGSGHYTPSFIKLNEAAVPHVITRDGKKVDSLAPYSEIARAADKKAFAALMKELKAYDPQHTVVMVQVENEIGTWGSVRDFSAKANALFAGAVPPMLLDALHKKPGTWSEVFGDDADESFYTWSIARYVNEVAAAGKAEYPLPMYVNVETRDPLHGKRGSYESGGAVDTVLPIWRAAAPAINAYGPDMYVGDYAVYTALLDVYHRPDNPMFVPETSNRPEFARYFFATLGHDGIGFSPFGMDATGYANAPLGADASDPATVTPFAAIYKAFAPMEREVARLNFEGKLQGVSEPPDDATQTLPFAAWKANVSYGFGSFLDEKKSPEMRPKFPSGGAMVAQLGKDEFLVTGVQCRVEFVPALQGLQRQWVRVEEGAYQDGVWHMSRLWNGDQSDYGLNFGAEPVVLRVTVATY